MKLKFGALLCAVLLLVMSFPTAWAAQDAVVKEFIYSGDAFEINPEADIADNAGLLRRIIGAGGKCNIVSDEEKHVGVLRMYGAGTFTWINNWARASTKNLAISTSIKIDDRDGTRQTYTHATGAEIIMLQINKSGDNVTLKSCGKTVDYTIVPNVWYNVFITIQALPEPMLNLYINDEKVASNKLSQTEINTLTNTATQFNNGTSDCYYYLGDTRMYVPGAPSASLEKVFLDSTSENVIVNFDKDIDAETVSKETIAVSDMRGNPVPFEITPKLEKGFVRGVTFRFPSGLSEDMDYKIDLSNLRDIIGQQCTTKELKFVTPSPQVPYEFGRVKLYQGFGMTPSSSLTSGQNFISAEVSNKGERDRSVLMIAAVYSGNVLQSISYNEVALNAQETATLTTGINAPSSDARVEVMFWKSFEEPYPLCAMQVVD